jgi:glycosyltransferase involved in cell wall biosynthesis
MFLNAEARAEATTGPEAPEQRGAENRLRGLFPDAPEVNGEAAAPGPNPLALFCFEAPDGPVGRFLAKAAGALARRGRSVHVFTRRGFETTDAGVTIHVLGEADGDIVEQADEISRRACNAFLKLFPGGEPVGLFGCEWSAAPALSLLRGLKGHDAVLTLCSLERQRSDLSGDLSRRIEAIEATALRECRAVLAHDQAALDAARALLPECADRLALLATPFPAESFATGLDAGAVKARYQVGPVDPTVVCVGDLDERYGPDLLLKAMPAILKNHKQARLIVVGAGQLYWPLRVYARYLLLEHAVRLAGDVSDGPLRELIAAADVVAVPSRAGTPWWPIQAAWAARRPVVATHDAAPGLIAHERDGVLVYPSENSIVWGVERVLFDADLRKTLADNGAAALDRRFGWGAVAAQVEELLAPRTAGERRG